MDKELHKQVMVQIQDEWESNRRHHEAQRKNPLGIRSSQISAVIGYLIEKEIITEDHLEE